MKRLNRSVGQVAIPAMSASATVAFPPRVAAPVSRWNGEGDDLAMPEFDLIARADGAEILADFELFGAFAHAGTIADDTFGTVTAAADTVVLTSHGLQTGDGPVQFTTSGTLPAGLSLATDYYVITVDANTVQFATSRDNAFANTQVDITDTGSGTHTLVDTADTKRITWVSWGLLGPDVDGALTLASGRGYAERWLHDPNVLAYGLIATWTNSAQVDVDIYAIQEF